MMELVIIAAVADNGVIGRDGTLPWHLPEDLAHFKETTMGHPVIMGRIAFEDILEHLGEPLPGRTNIVLSRGDPEVPAEVILVPGIDAAIDAAAETDSDRAFIAGGRTIYEEMLPRTDRMILTELDTPYEGDVTFPDWDRTNWIEIDRTPGGTFDIVEYESRT